MARTKGMLNLSGNLEVNAQAPLDARTIVPTEADLTVANNFPYPYVGLEVYVTGTGKKFRLINLDTTQSSSWHEVGEGGGGSGLPSGGTAGQYLVKQSATEGDADWQSLNSFTGATSQAAGAAGLVPAPAIGDEGKVLFGNGLWGALPSVDLSVLSNDAFQFSTDEKPVGMWTDRKILYAKTVDCGALPNNNFKRVAHNISNLEAVHFLIGSAKSSTDAIPINFNWTDNVSSTVAGLIEGNNIVLGTGVDRSSYTAYVTLFYTKTTDSPLSSDEKFAGVTSGGEVIYEKTLTVNNVTVPEKVWTNLASTPSNSDLLIDSIIYTNANLIAYPFVRFNNGYLQAFNATQIANINKATIRYTKSS